MTSVGIIARQVADIRGVPINDMLSRRRKHPACGARQETMYFARLLTRSSLPEIGRRLGRYDHSTVLHNIRAVEMRIETHVGYGDEIEVIGARLRSILDQVEVSPIDILTATDAVEVARRIDAASLDMRGLVINQDELRALAAHVLFAHPPQAAPSAGSDAMAQEAPTATRIAAVLRAFTAFENARFTRGEHGALDRLLADLTDMRTALQQKRS